jgi:hypothetical protein
VVRCVDPYNPDAKHDLREELRLNNHGVASLDKATYNYYVSGNLPASTALYGLIEWLSGGRGPHSWRLILISGDLALMFAAYFFLRLTPTGVAVID